MENKEYSVICFGGLDWWYHNRAHADIQVVKRFAKKGKTLYINSIVMQKPNFRNLDNFLKRLVRKAKSIFTGLKRVDDNLWVYSPFSIPLHHIPFMKWLNDMLLLVQVKIVSIMIGIYNPIVWIVIPVAYHIARRLKKQKLVYYKLDKYELFPNVERETVAGFDIEARRNADMTIFVSKELYDEGRSGCKNPLYLDHGVDYELFETAESLKDVPADIAGIPKPIIGYFGTIDKHTVDTDFLGRVADKIPAMSFVFVGPAAAEYPELTGHDNVYMLGIKPYEQVPHYGKCFDVAVMAWQKTEWIKMCNPIKLKEYLALGKPTISTSFPELDKYREVVYIADNPDAFAEMIKKALAENNGDLVAQRKKVVENETWDYKVKYAMSILLGK